MIELEKTATGIEQLVAQWHCRLKELSGEEAHVKPSADRWSISEVIGHLVDSACNNHQRFVRAQFLDSLTFPKYEQNQWVDAANYIHTDWPTLVDLWASYNKILAHLIRNISEDRLETPCTITPYETCTLEFLVTDYLTHLRHHLEKIEGRIDS